MNTQQFLDIILPSHGRRVAGILTNGKFSNHFLDTNGELASDVMSIDAKKQDAYYALSGYGPENKRTQGNAVALRCFFLDIDTREGKANAPYANRREAVLALESFCDALGLSKPALVSSGNGIHAYWPVDVDMTPDAWLPTAKLLKAAAGKFSLHIDNSRTTDSASVLRPPGTHNWKDPANPKPVKLLRSAVASTHKEFHELLEKYVPAKLPAPFQRLHDAGGDLNADLMLPPTEFPPSYLSQIANQCAVMGKVRDTGGDVQQPVWYHALQLISCTVEAATAIHDYSSGYPGYTSGETEEAYERASRYGPTLCSKFADHEAILCQACPNFGKITSPISLGLKPQATVTAAQQTVAGKNPVSSVQQFRPMELTEFPSSMDGEDPSTIEFANRLFVMIAFNSGQVFGPGLIGPTGDIRKLDTSTGKTLTANIRVRVPVGESAKHVPLYDFWLNHPDRLTFNEALFCPPSSDVVLKPGSLNTYRGLGVVSQQGTIPLILRHIYRVIAAGDHKVFKYIIKYLAHLMVKPGERPGVAIILQGDIEGGGKSIFLNLIVRMVGDHALSVATTDRLSSRFNAQVENKIVVACHEGLLGVGHGQANKLKSEITDPYIEVEGKGQDVRIVANYARYFLATNEAFPVRSGKGARRFLVCKISNRYARNRKYFEALSEEINNGGAEAFLYYLQNQVALDQFNPSADMPRTEALADQQEFSAAPHVKWALDVADGADGTETFSLPVSHFDNPEPITFGQPISYQALHDNFRRWGTDTGERSTMTMRGLSRWLRDGLKLTSTQVGQNRLKGCIMPATAAEFDRLVRSVESIG